MIRNIVLPNQPSLRKKSKPVKKIDKKTLSLIKDLKDTLVAQSDPVGIGLAAPQIGKNVRIFLVKPKDKIEVFINPQIVKLSKKEKVSKKDTEIDKQPPIEKKIMEGCLSIPHFYGPLKRNKRIRVKFQNQSGKEVVSTFEGIKAQIIQHEIDHLNGILFTDHLLKQKKPLYELVDGEWEEVELF
jgi:peptide deformylase